MNGLLGVVLLALVVIGMLDVAKSRLPTGKKALWAVLILMLPLLGLILYVLLGRKK